MWRAKLETKDVTMLYFLFVFIFLLASFSYYRYIRNGHIGLQAGLVFGIIYIGMIPMFVLLLAGRVDWPDNLPVPKYSLDVVVSEHRGALMVILGLYGVYLLWDMLIHAYLTSRPEKPEKAYQSKGVLTIYWLIGAYLFVTVALFLMTGLASGGHWAHSRADFLQAYGPLGQVFAVSHAALRVSILILLAYAYLQSSIKLWAVAAFLVPLCAVDIYTTGNRIWLLQVAVLFFTIFIFKKEWWVITCGAVACIPFGLLMILWGPIRSRVHNYNSDGVGGKIEAFLNAWQFAIETVRLQDMNILRFLGGISESTSLNVYVALFRVFPDHINYLYGDSIIRIMSFWVPRSIWPDKPFSTQILIGYYFYPDLGVSFSTTTFGEFYMNFGVFGVLFIPPVFLCLAYSLKRIANHPHIAMLLIFVFGFTLVRMSLSVTFIVFLFSAVILRFTKPVNERLG